MRIVRTFWFSIWLLTVAPYCFAASSFPEKPRPTGDAPLVFVLPPFENVSLLYENFLPLKQYLERRLSRKIVLKVAQNYQDAIDQISTGRAGLAYLDPAAYCEAHYRSHIVPLVKTIRNGSATYRSVLVVRNDSPIRKIVDAKGKVLALGNLSSSSSSLIPAVMFKQVGIGLRDFKAVNYLEQEDRIALSVLTRRHDVGGLSERVARKYLDDGLRIIDQSESVPQYTLCASALLPDELQQRIRASLLALGKNATSADVPQLKDIDGFAPASDRDFDVVRVMIKNLTGKNYLEYGKNSVKVAILPLYSAIELFDRFDPLMRYLSDKTGQEFKLVIPKDFEDFFHIVKRGQVQFSYSNPYIYIQLADGGHLTAFANTVLQSSGDNFRGIVITRSDSPIRTIEDLKGKKVMAVSYKSAGGFLVQKLLLSEKGLDVFRDLRLSEGKRQEEVILNVYRGTVDAGFVRESALDVLKEELDLSKIRIVARTPYIANWPFAASKTAAPDLIQRVKQQLLSLSDKNVLGAAQIVSFKDATDQDFDVLRSRIKGGDGK